MLEVINLALPFFGLIFLGFGCGKFKAIPDSGLAWMDFFILYVALPALFYRIVAQTPLDTVVAVPVTALWVTVKVNGAGPDAVGIPEMTPVEGLMVRPAGNDPAVTDQV